MLNMQAFHNRLSSTDETPNTLLGHMARLAHVSRVRIKEITGDLVWFIWEAGQVADA